MLINARSIVNKIDDLKVRIFTDNPDIIGITETWAHKDVLNEELNIPNYKIIRKDRLNRAGGGILFYINQNLNADIIESDTDIEGLWCEIREKSLNCRIGLYYRPPNSSEEYINKICDEITMLKSNNYIIMGDFNFPDIDWNILSSTKLTEKFLDLCLDQFLIQHVKEPTRKQNILDIVLTNNQNLIHSCETAAPLGDSDHNIVKFSLRCEKKFQTKQQVRINFKKADFHNIRHFLRAIDWQARLQNLNTQESWNYLKDIMMSINANIENSKKSCCTTPRWFNNDIKVLVSRKKTLWKIYKANRNAENFERYKIVEKQAKALIKKSKKSLEELLVTDIKNNPKKFYSYVSTKRITPKINTLKTENNIITDDTEKAEQLNSFFSSVFTVEDESSMPAENEVTDKHIETIEISTESVKQKLNGIKETKSPGPDDIYPRILKECHDILATPLAIIFNKSLDEGVVVEDWKIANVTPIFKKGSVSKVENYRPISLTSVPCKILESIIKDSLVKFLDENKLIKATQHGFTTGRSCLSNLLEYLDFITKAVDEKKSVDSIMLDFSKAFDKVPHKRLLLKVRNLGIKGPLLEWIRDWLKDRKQRVILNGKISKWLPVLSGVPQGSVLGPLLFLIYVNDIDDCVTSKISKFADDTKLYDLVHGDSDNHIQRDIDSLSKWAHKWQMKFNASKCKVLHFGSHNSRLDYSLDGNRLENSVEERDLGVIINQNLKSDSQVNQVAVKAHRILGMIYRTIENKTKDIILPLYLSLVRPHLEYCVQAWSPHYYKDINKIEKVQKRAVNMIKDIRSIDYTGKLRELNLFSMSRRRMRGDMIEVYKILSGKEKIDKSNLFNIVDSPIYLRGHKYKIQKKCVRTDIRRNFFTHRIVNLWNSLPNSVVECSSLDKFKSSLDKYFNSLQIV